MNDNTEMEPNRQTEWMPVTRALPSPSAVRNYYDGAYASGLDICEVSEVVLVTLVTAGIKLVTIGCTINGVWQVAANNVIRKNGYEVIAWTPMPEVYGK